MGKKSKRRVPKPIGPKILEARASGKAITFTGEDILIRLIDTAIMLWFHDGDILSVHMLGSAAYKTLRDITKETGKVPWLTEIIGDERLTVAYDFIRHASSDLTEVLNFPPAANMTLLAGAVTTFEAVFGRRTNFMSILMLRFLTDSRMDTQRRGSVAYRYLANKYLPENFPTEDFAKLGNVDFFKNTLQVLQLGG